MKLNTLTQERLNNYHFNKKNVLKNKNKLTDGEENLLSLTYLTLKICLFLLAIVSSFKIGSLSKVRIDRLKEIQSSYIYEKARFRKLANRFDELLSLKGEQRFMKDQDQMISRDVMRVIWR